MERDLVQRRGEDDENEREPGREADDLPAGCAVAAHEEQVPDRERRNDDESLEIRRPRIDRALERTLRYGYRGRSSAVEPQVSNPVARVDPAARFVRRPR